MPCCSSCSQIFLGQNKLITHSTEGPSANMSHYTKTCRTAISVCVCIYQMGSYSFPLKRKKKKKSVCYLYLVKRLVQYSPSNNILQFLLLMYIFAVVWDVFKWENLNLLERGRNCQGKELLTKDAAPTSAITIMFNNVLTFNLPWRCGGVNKPFSKSSVCASPRQKHLQMKKRWHYWGKLSFWGIISLFCRTDRGL